MNEPPERLNISGFRVTKKFSATARGAIKLARRFGDSFVCVRYRVDAAGRYRYTTVELIVDKNLVVRRPDPDVNVKAWSLGRSLTSQMQAAGAIWDARAKLWRLPRSVAVRLGLKDRIVQEESH